MDNAGYTTLTRQSGLKREMTVLANNIANAATTGYRAGGITFSEFIKSAPGTESISMATANVQTTLLSQGALKKTGGSFDFAIEGTGFFMVQTPEGERLTRAGAFTPNENGDLVNMDGHLVLDGGGAPIFIPPDAKSVDVSSDGTFSVDGQPFAQIGLYRPTNPLDLKRETGVLFDAPDGVEPVEEGRVLQGFLESSNVDPILQMARMIDVQRAYEMGQTFLENEHSRIRDAVKTFVR
ncbi:flagellar hook-basal body complex protein [Shimia marina]|uniref:Flagellar basal-body rod protein FlgF n=1 Tax=Shimia marina TaxID=321267 RepID=A0A0P1EMT4_9RHOB|nr:flagellar hook-basal body complex protein [Shimia marina]CUH51362.1 Distal rod protein [Shimia marina]SFD51018.1 flagellar basal-body rod protein FlgF [Shimia marina]